MEPILNPMLPIVAVVPRTAEVAAAGWSLVLVKLMLGGAQSWWSSVLVELITIDTFMRVMNAAVAPLHFSSVKQG